MYIGIEKMKLEFAILTIIILTLSVGLSGCEEVDKRFIGTWTPNQIEYPTYTFYSNKKYSIQGVDGTWSVQNGLLVLKNDNITEKYKFKFSANNYVLTLTGVKEGIERTYIKET